MSYRAIEGCADTMLVVLVSRRSLAMCRVVACPRGWDLRAPIQTLSTPTLSKIDMAHHDGEP